MQSAAISKDLTRGQKVRVARIKRRWTQQDLAREAGLLTRTVTLVELDKSDLRDKTIGKLANALDIAVEELI